MEINKQQKIAIEHGRGAMMVLAGPGSGKTFVITRRIRYMIRNLQIPPEQILVITFTKAAATEMEKRFQDFMENEYLPVTFGTFHAIFFHIIKYSYHYDYSNIITEKEKRNYIKEVLETLNAEGVDTSYSELLLTQISKVKNEGKDPKTYQVSYLEEGIFYKIYKNYEELKAWNRKIDFDDMVLLCRNLFLKESKILEYWQKRYRFILIDEFQDINPLQYEVIKMLSSPENNLFIVGDDDQSIYGFRGSDPGIMLNFTKEFPKAQTVTLPVNYRSTPEIVNAASYLIGHNKKRYKKRVKANQCNGESARCIAFQDKRSEAEYLAKLLQDYSKMMPWEEMAVLYRSSIGIEFIVKTLSEKSIPFIMKERISNPFSTDIYKDIFAYLAFVYGDYRRKHMLQIMNKPLRYIKRCYITEENVDLKRLLSATSIPDYVKKHMYKLIQDFDFMKAQPPYGALYYLRKGVGYEAYLLEKLDRKKRDEIASLLDFFQELSKKAQDFGEWKRIMEETEEDMIKSVNVKTENVGVTLSTMHAAKGLEYRLVILPDVNEGNIPQSKADSKEAIEEERRIFYVAMTRAKEKLFLLYVKSTKENRLQKSRFLSQIKFLKEEDYSSSSASINSSNS